MTDVRNALEHRDATVVSGNVGFGYGIGKDGVLITHNGTRLNLARLSLLGRVINEPACGRFCATWKLSLQGRVRAPQVLHALS
ncbi:hypothetical protein HEP84_06635 [Streptomyces sp. RLB1-33]|uniref:hypothetical protein n=1 Tax=Streptomyces mirabilis TaxID=68239 RepID=UPI00143E6F0D|nr:MULTISPECIES: hypothetical protein [Streptomyces]QIY68925.1 hypothetical protein HEP84_06635 [Streptomyces sp. RLB1-33]QUW84306.1 hypothetical protein SMIR_38490 [Streptomyces mirabilis]